MKTLAGFSENNCSFCSYSQMIQIANKCDCATCEYADVCNGNYVNKYGECELYIPEGWHDFTPEEKKAIFGDAEWSMSQYGYEG